MTFKNAAERKKTEHPETVRTYPINVNNPQFNSERTDSSANGVMVTSEQFFAQLRGALIDMLPDGPEKSNTLARLDALEEAKGYTFLRHYSGFIAGAASHMNVVYPFIPGLTSILVRV